MNRHQIRKAANAGGLEKRVVSRPLAPLRRVTVHALSQAGPFDKWFSSLVNKPQTNTALEERPAPAVEVNGSSHAGGYSSSGSSNNVVPLARNAPKRDYLEARQVSIYQLLDGEEMKFDIPVYQRPYSWGTKQVFEMMEDFVKAYSAKQEYFLGAIVTVRGSGGPSSSYQVIDGQQRLTTLFIMLACLHDWAKEQGNEVLQQRVWRMLHLEADPLDGAASSSRFRLQLREADDGFFTDNVMQSFLPRDFHFSGVAVQQPELAASSPSSPSSSSASSPLDAEAHWRLYQNASFMKAHMRQLVSQQHINLQDFMFHVLRNCYLVVMTARDEASSFRIFSTLNSRGVDLSEVDKLKADLLQVLEPAQRVSYSSRWAEMENLLGRQQFHRVFGYMKELASVLEPELASLTVLEYFTRELQPHSVSQVIQVALDYARLLLQLRSAKWGVDAAAVGPGGSGEEAEEGGGGAAVALALAAQSRLVNLFDDEAWLPATLEFFLQVDSPALRLRFLRAAEVQVLFLALQGDAALRASTWKRVTQALLIRPLQPEAVLEAISLSSEEKAMFLAKLDSKDLAATVDQRTLAHLLLRAEGLGSTAALADAAIQQAQAEAACLQAEASLQAGATVQASGQEAAAAAMPVDSSDAVPEQPSHAAEASSSGAGADALLPQESKWRSLMDPASPAPAPAATPTATPAPAPAAAAASAPAPAPAPAMELSIRLERLRVERVVPQQAPEGSAWRRTKLQEGGAGGTGTAGEDSKYWYEVQRLSWQGKLGNLVLIPYEAAGASAVAGADYDVKAAFLRQCGAEAMFPRFSGSVSAAGGRYSRHRFSFEECRQRHLDLLQRLAELYDLM